ncbi:MAG: hypothetical protein AAF696_01400 [Bacteroidota bacterium]
MNKNIKQNNLVKLASLAMALTLFSFTQVASEKPINLVFVDHLTAGLIEQDVFVEKETGSNEVYRVLPNEKEKYLDAPLYKSIKKLKHDPFDPSTAGPFEKGEALGMTLREWLSAKGTGSYTCEGGWGTFKASFQNLVPNATYTIWHAFMAKAATKPFAGTIDLPLGDPNGETSVFTTDEKGNAVVEKRFERCLQLGEVQLMSLVALAYHSDGKTYKADAGPFGLGTHVQIFAVLPDAEKAVKEISSDN